MLRRAIQGVNITNDQVGGFMITQQQSGSINSNTNSSSNTMAGSIKSNKVTSQKVKVNVANSIMEENQSQLYDTIEGKGMGAGGGGVGDNYHDDDDNNDDGDNDDGNNNDNNTDQNIVDDTKTPQQQQRYHIPAKQISKKRQ